MMRKRLPVLSEESIQKVVNALGCSKARAKTLLYLNDNDADQAIVLYKYSPVELDVPTPVDPSPPVPSPEPPPSPHSTIANNSATESILFDTHQTDSDQPGSTHRVSSTPENNDQERGHQNGPEVSKSGASAAGPSDLESNFPEPSQNSSPRNSQPLHFQSNPSGISDSHAIVPKPPIVEPSEAKHHQSPSPQSMFPDSKPELSVPRKPLPKGPKESSAEGIPHSQDPSSDSGTARPDSGLSDQSSNSSSRGAVDLTKTVPRSWPTVAQVSNEPSTKHKPKPMIHSIPLQNGGLTPPSEYNSKPDPFQNEPFPPPSNGILTPPKEPENSILGEEEPPEEEDSGDEEHSGRHGSAHENEGPGEHESPGNAVLLGDVEALNEGSPASSKMSASINNAIKEPLDLENQRSPENGAGRAEIFEPEIEALPELTLELELEVEWDFVLPYIQAPFDLAPGGKNLSGTFSLRDLIGAMQHGASLDKIETYLRWYEDRAVSNNINGLVEGFPAMFYAVATNNDRIIRAWVDLGGDVNATCSPRGGPESVPLLAFAVINSDNIQNDTTFAVATLLSLGAHPKVIPKSFFIPFDNDLPDKGPEEKDLKDLKDKNKKWCTPAARAKLARCLNLSQRYFLEKAVKTKKPSIRHRQVAIRKKSEALLGIQYFLIGQTTAAGALMRKLLSYMVIPSKRPLVLVFAGPSGHGKTELARRLGYLLSLELEIVDCTIYSRESDLFGHRAPYTGSERGTPLNNFLARKAGQRCVVFLDEFEKTTADVHKSLLLPFDNGDYQDRRHLTNVDCSKTLWILATNALDPIIKDFCKMHKKIVIDQPESPEMPRLMKLLGNRLKDGFKDRFEPPLTGRVSAFLPFLPFTLSEQAVVAHKYILELTQKVRKKINLSFRPEEQLLGNVYLRVRRDGSLCKLLAAEGYDEDLGARSLIVTVKSIVEDVVVEAYLEVNEEIVEDQKLTEFVVDITPKREVVVHMVNVEPLKETDDEEEDDDNDDDRDDDDDESDYD